MSGSGSLIDDYLCRWQRSQEQHGPDSCLLMQVGSFYESYSADAEGGKRVGNCERLSRLLNIVLTKKNKKDPSCGRKNPFMVGFPTLALPKYLPVLLDAGLVVVVVDQAPEDPTKRERVEVFSPGTFTELPTESLRDCTNSAMVDVVLLTVVVEQLGRGTAFGACTINATTGVCLVSEKLCNAGEVLQGLDMLEGSAQVTQPREVLWCVMEGERQARMPAEVPRSTETVRSMFRMALQVRLLDSLAVGELERADAQALLLGETFPPRSEDHEASSMLSPLERLDLERFPFAALALCLGLSHLHGQSPERSRGLLPPVLVGFQRGSMSLDGRTLVQLSVLPSPGCPEALSKLLDHTLTPMGKRLLREHLSAPLTCKDAIEDRLRRLDSLLEMPPDDIGALRAALRGVGDLPRLLRRLCVSPQLADLRSLHDSCVALVSVRETIAGWEDLEIDLSVADLAVGDIQDRFQVQALTALSSSMAGNPLEDVDLVLKGLRRRASVSSQGEVSDRLSRARHLRSRLLDQATDLGDLAGAKVNLAASDLEGFFLTCNPTAGAVLHERLPDKVTVVKSLKSMVKVSGAEIRELSEELMELRAQLMLDMQDLVLECVGQLDKPCLQSLAHAVASLDLLQSHAQAAVALRLCRPRVKDDKRGSSLLVRDLRHPLIEAAQQQVRYVPYDVVVGPDCKGWVVYGVNSGGKTSLLKSVGVAVILAQAGMYVPASEMEWTPFHDIVTQVDFHDDMFKGRSSFVVEMMGLGVILRRAGPHTLVVCDEVTKGTEVLSGTAIFVATVRTLLLRGARFLFSTHLHGAAALLEQDPGVQICHLAVQVDGDGTVIFERQLKQGPGPSLYGLEIAQAVLSDPDFLRAAEQIRDCLLNTEDPDTPPTSTPRRSRYNTRKLVSKCELCGYRPVKHTDCPLDTHHLRPRSEALPGARFSDGERLNALNNLAALCKECHDKVHKENRFLTYVNTSKGVQLRAVQT
jgi:DNA mismatch repair protein MutS